MGEPHTEFTGKRITVMGLGQFGGGLGAARFLANAGAHVTVTDIKPQTSFAEPIAQLSDLINQRKISLALGGHREQDFTTADLVIANPAVAKPWNNHYLNLARAHNVHITTEINLLLARLPSTAITIAVTGTAGKSTTTAMIAHALAALAKEPGSPLARRPIHLGGNIGKSLLDQLPLSPNSIIILELSSFMLYWSGQELHWSPNIAIWTNLSENHLDWHGPYADYAAAKHQIIAHQSPQDFAIIGQLTNVPQSCQTGPANTLHITEPHALVRNNLSIPGSHNELNATMALHAVHRACTLANPATNAPVSLHRIAQHLSTFPGLEHRLCLCHTTADKKRFFNDSKSTTLAATLQALESLRKTTPSDPIGLSHIHLLVGGDAKGQDLSPLATIASSLASIICFGKDGPTIHKTLAHLPYASQTQTLQQATQAAISTMKPADILLLSPACASWDQFTNYEYRGQAFAELVKSLAK